MSNKWFAIVSLGLALFLGTIAPTPADDSTVPGLSNDQKQKIALDVLSNAPPSPLNLLPQCSTFGIHATADDSIKDMVTADDLAGRVKDRLSGHGLNATIEPTTAPDCWVDVDIDCLKSTDSNGKTIYSGSVDIYANVGGYVVNNGKIESINVDVADNHELFVTGEDGAKDEINGAVEADMDAFLKEYDSEKSVN